MPKDTGRSRFGGSWIWIIFIIIIIFLFMPGFIVEEPEA
ncbi:hypothetical protein Thert_03500 [Thermoanaerobacterium thermosaccharolyticum]|jgi:hypothetical protein|uniref:Uncharacterized protein n=4 Tax=Thermoanaerobacterium TaxID=28895 RepID=D9TPS2_THETC|nr:hypothetical protein Tthe_1239 [Thermoanaerobacterium thermosaccharolyticum DSM 571]AGB18845.1 hypothetical protein Thethe_01196 [Thermoanaerobacterium thermosaccharolyticum M0795]AST59212.1 hypothetical protein Thert_03500 [Thermoanaerobacterium thermosaccharolyticum]MBP2073304.1 hypothetical protein [Thermoanaerobacterium butyriciformans]TCW37325.1 hypothetical protein EDC21_108130 [Thermohydrogenium kirishiense]